METTQFQRVVRVIFVLVLSSTVTGVSATEKPSIGLKTLMRPSETPEKIISWTSWLIQANKQKYQQVETSEDDDLSTGSTQSSGNEKIRGNRRCRSQGFYLPRPLYDLQTCALCYAYIPDKPGIFRPGAKWKSRRFEVVDAIDDDESDSPSSFGVGDSSTNQPTHDNKTIRHHVFLLHSPDGSLWVSSSSNAFSSFST